MTRKALCLILLATFLSISIYCLFLYESNIENISYHVEQTSVDFEQTSNEFESTLNKFEPTSNDIENSDVPIPVVDEHTNEDSKLELVTGVYLNIHYYTKYLKILREQHNKMLYDLLHKADLAVANTSVYSVTLKTQLAPSKDLHDYMSLARYFWPNPKTKDGLPYIRRDGLSNPEISSVPDYNYLRKLMNDIQHLGLAYFFTRNDTYVKKAIYRLNEWFIDPKTMMNPNLNYGSLIKGFEFGRRTGIIDFRPIFKITQSISIMSSSNYWDHNIESKFKKWLTNYYEWLITSKHGRDEHKAKNNHGTFYDVQVIYILQYLDRIEEAKEFGWKALKNRVNTGILADGQQHHETSRSTSWFYSVFNLQGLFLLAERTTQLGFDGWNYRGINNQSIKTAVDYLLPFALNGGEGWKFKNIAGFKLNDYIRILELSWIIWGDDKYLDAVETLRPKSKLEQALGSHEVLEDNSLCIWSLMNEKCLWSCFN